MCGWSYLSVNSLGKGMPWLARSWGGGLLGLVLAETGGGRVGNVEDPQLEFESNPENGD